MTVGINGSRSNSGQCASLLFVVLFFWISYEFLLVCSYRALVIVSVMECFYSHNDFTQELWFHLNVYLFKAQVSHEFRYLNQMDHWPPSQHHSSWFISFSIGRYLWQGWPSLSSPKTKKLMNVHIFRQLRNALDRVTDSSWEAARVYLGSVEPS